MRRKLFLFVALLGVSSAAVLTPSAVNRAGAVPTSALVSGPDAARIVLYRLPLTKRCSSRQEVEDSTWQVILDRLAEVWKMSPDDIDPRG